MQLFNTRKQQCPVCKTLLNAASNPIGDYNPKPGDLSICIKCKTVLKFGEAMEFILASQEEVDSAIKQIDDVKDLLSKKYSITSNEQGAHLLCHLCGYTSHNKNDIKHKYCGHCHTYLEYE